MFILNQVFNLSNTAELEIFYLRNDLVALLYIQLYVMSTINTGNFLKIVI
jgi:hypothetical protein